MVGSRLVLVRNLSYRATAENVRSKFATAGTIEECQIRRIGPNDRNCMAQLKFSTSQEAREAAIQFDNTQILGRTVRTELAKDDTVLRDVRSSLSANMGPVGSESSLAAADQQSPVILNGSDNDNEESPFSSVRASDGKQVNFGSQLQVSILLTDKSRVTKAELLSVQLRR